MIELKQCLYIYHIFFQVWVLHREFRNGWWNGSSLWNVPERIWAI